MLIRYRRFMSGTEPWPDPARHEEQDPYGRSGPGAHTHGEAGWTSPAGPATGGWIPTASTTGSFATERSTEPVGLIGPATAGHRLSTASQDVGARDDGPGLEDDQDDTDYDDDRDDTDYEADAGGADGGGRLRRASTRVRGSRLASRRWSDAVDDDAPDDAPDDGDDDRRGGRRAAGARGPRGPKNGRKPIIGWRRAIAVFVVALVVGLTLRATIGSHSGGSGASPSLAPLPTATPVPADFLQSAATDSDPVTANEFFRDTQFTEGTHTYARLDQRLDTGCPNLTGLVALALSGRVSAAPAPTVSANPSAAPAAAATATPVPTPTGPICRQQDRALYAGEPDKNGRRVFAGVAVLVLDTAARATQAATALAARAGGVTPLQLPAGALPGAKASAPNGDRSLRTAFADGHYAVVVDLAYSDASKVTTTDGPLSDAATDLRAQALEPLDARMTSGHGYRG
jgi:hypothetical protein